MTVSLQGRPPRVAPWSGPRAARVMCDGGGTELALLFAVCIAHEQGAQHRSAIRVPRLLRELVAGARASTPCGTRSQLSLSASLRLITDEERSFFERRLHSRRTRPHLRPWRQPGARSYPQSLPRPTQANRYAISPAARSQPHTRTTPFPRQLTLRVERHVVSYLRSNGFPDRPC